MRKKILLFGMKRSGNHGIINWLRGQNPFIFCNNIIPIAPMLVHKQPFPKPCEFNPWLNQRRDNQVKGDDWSCLGNHQLKSIADHDVLVSIEDQDILSFPFVINDEPFQTLLVLRDPVNMLASRIKRAASLDHPAYPKTTGPMMDRVVATWKSHAREYLGLTQHLPNKTNIYFNAWFSSAKYREHISHQLSLEFNDSGFTRVSKEGGGSSFEGTSKSGANQKMEVLNRLSYLNEAQQNLIQNVLLDPEITELASAVETKTLYVQS